MIEVLILGWGNTLRSDDGVGWRVAEELSRASLGPGVEVRALHQLVPELADEIGRAGSVLFVDARAEGAPGELRIREIEGCREESKLTHRATPAGLLALAEELGGGRPPAWEISLSGASFALGETLSEAVASRMRGVVEIVAALAGAVRGGHCRGTVDVVR